MADCRRTTSLKPVFFTIHKGVPCIECHLRKEKQAIYYHLLQTLEPSVTSTTCICCNCHNSLYRDASNPRWRIQSSSVMACEIPNCKEPSCRCTKIVPRDEIGKLLNCLPLEGTGFETELCSSYYRLLHRQVKPDNYQ